MTSMEAAYLDRMMLPVFFCSRCGRSVQLPYRQFLSSSLVEPYWPDADPAMPWVCDACGRFQSYTEHDLRWMADGTLSALPSSRGFWRVEIPCRAPGCGSNVVAHVQTFGQTSRRSLGLMLAKAFPTPTCENGHALSEEGSYPERIDFVEWTGPEQYIT